MNAECRRGCMDEWNHCKVQESKLVLIDMTKAEEKIREGSQRVERDGRCMERWVKRQMDD